MVTLLRSEKELGRTEKIGRINTSSSEVEQTKEILTTPELVRTSHN